MTNCISTRFRLHGFSLVVAAVLWVAAPPAWGMGASGEDLDFFEKRIRPVLVDRCYGCHSARAEKLKAGLRLDSREALLQGGDSGPALTPGDPDRSLLVRAVEYDSVDLQMPPDGRLGGETVQDLRRWVARGAPWGASAEGESETLPSQREFDLEQRRRSHWSWQPIAPSPPPTHREEATLHPIDAFLEASLEAAEIQPAPMAEPRMLVRRLYLDLLGLPPSPLAVEDYGKRASPEAWESLVDRLLDSPHFGERWARHWMDLMRYADTLGHEFDYPIPNAWRYRDYLIRAFNADVPYDRFAREHLAGDLLSHPRRNPENGMNESLIGTSFFWFGQRVHSPVDVKQNEADIIDNQIDVLTKSFLGLTVACARCHDHKFDAISTRDYYALYGALASSRYLQRSIEFPDGHRDLLNQLRGKAGTLRRTLEVGAVPVGILRPAALPPAGDGIRVLADFSRTGYSGWSREGPAFGETPASAGDVVVVSSNRLAVLTSPVAHSAGVSRRLQGALLSPSFVISHRYLHVEAAGRESRLNVVVNQHTLIRDPIYGTLKRVVDHDELRWITIDLAMWQGRRAYLELSDLAAPDPADDGHRQGFDLAGYLAVRRVVLSDAPETPDTFPEPAWTFIDVKASTDLARELETYRQLEDQLTDPLRVPAMVDGNGVDEAVFIRGNPRNPGTIARRGFLTALSPGGADFRSAGSGRDELADRIVDPANPFFARVQVNRVWHHLFGRGLVATPDDWGVLGQPPSHPDLLDWLAEWFRTEGEWSTKSLIRLLVTSRAYRRSSRPMDTRAEERDPMNRLWHRMPIRRLESETIRDTILAVSGRLDPRLYGPAVAAHVTEFMEGRGRPAQSGPVDGEGRRSVYLEVRRNFLSPLLRTFDTPVPFTTVGHRTVSNVPAQSLILLNDPFVAGEARRWAERRLAGNSCSHEERLQRLFQEAFARAPTPDEIRQCQEFLHARGSTSFPAATELEVWTDLCHVLFNVKEFIFLY